MKKIKPFFLSLFLGLTNFVFSQDTNTYKLFINIPLVDLSENFHYPTMNQSLEFSNSLYELSFWGIDELGNKIFISKKDSKKRKFSNLAFKYALSYGFSKFGSELPIPFGVWAHEEFHRSTLKVENINAMNGNWIFNRWDGTVYGISDQELDNLKNKNLNQLLYSYVAGIQYEILSNQKNTLNDFYLTRTFNKNALLLYNAYYTFNYFKFSTSSFTDSVKIIAPPHESTIASNRDYAGADLTAWAYDMFNPNLPFSSRDSFPNGEGVNRRVGISDLSPEALTYLEKQKKLSLLNFVNPAIFFINRIKINSDFSFNFFAQYSPTHFGNDIAFYIPLKYKKYDLLIDLHNYNNNVNRSFGLGLGIFNYSISSKISSDFSLNFWNQPRDFFANDNILGGAISAKTNYNISKNTSSFISLNAKSNGWIIGNEYLKNSVSIQFGINFKLI